MLTADLSRLFVLDAAHRLMTSLEKHVEGTEGDKRHQLRNRIAQLRVFIRDLEAEL